MGNEVVLLKNYIAPFNFGNRKNDLKTMNAIILNATRVHVPFMEGEG